MNGLKAKDKLKLVISDYNASRAFVESLRASLFGKCTFYLL